MKAGSKPAQRAAGDKAPNAQKVNLLRSIMETREFKDCEQMLDSSRDHSKLRKLFEVLYCFFTIGKSKESSKVIIFT